MTETVIWESNQLLFKWEKKKPGAILQFENILDYYWIVNSHYTVYMDQEHYKPEGKYVYLMMSELWL